MIHPVKDMVWITPIFDPDKIGSIWVPDMAKERVDQGLVKHIGPDVQDLKIGDYVLFPNYSGTLVRIDGEVLIGMRERFVSAILDIANTGFDIPGLYFLSKDGTHFPATYDQVFQLISSAITSNNLTIPARKSVDNKYKPLVNPDVNKEDYDEQNPYTTDKELRKLRNENKAS